MVNLGGQLMKTVAKGWGVRFALALCVAAIHDGASAGFISVSSYQVGGFYGPYPPGDDPPAAYPAVPTPDNTPGFQNYFMGRSTISGFTTSERRAFFIYDLAGVAASIPVGEHVVGVTIDLTLIGGGTSALANFTGGFELVSFTATPVPVAAIIDPAGFGVTPSSIWATFGTGIPFGDFTIVGPDSPGSTVPGTYTIGLPGAVSAIGPAIGSGSLFVVTARLATFDPGPIGAGAPPPVDPYEYVFGLTDVVSPTGSHAPVPYDDFDGSRGGSPRAIGSRAAAVGGARLVAWDSPSRGIATA